MITARSLSCVLPDGSPLFSQLNFTLEKKKYGLVGANGVGKTTLVRLLAKEIEPAEGKILGHVKVILLRQFEERPPLTVAEYLLDIWSTAFCHSPLYPVLSGSLDMGSSLSNLSGGEWMRVRLAKALGTDEESLLVLDEPTNNLDRSVREVLYQFVETYEGSLMIISHDRELLQRVDEVWELSNQGLQTYGGSFSYYEVAKRKEAENLKKDIDIARQEKKRQEREHHEKLERQQKRMRWGKENLESLGLPRIVAQARKRQAQKSLGLIHKEELKRDAKKEERFKTLYHQQKKISQWRPEFPEWDHQRGRNVVFSLTNFNYRHGGSQNFLWKEPLNFTLYSRERLCLRGSNGSGKTTLLRLLTSRGEVMGELQGELKGIAGKYIYLDQEYSILAPEKTILETLQEDGQLSTEELRNKLADFGFVAEEVFKKCASLSGGEKLRACLAKLILSVRTLEVLILDEPTNNLDLESLLLLEKALRAYQGTLILVTHDETLSQNIGCGSELNLRRYLSEGV